MNISKSVLQAAVEAKIIDALQAQQLWDFINKHQSHGAVSLLFYIGGLIAILSVSLLLSPYMISLDGWWMLIIFSIYLAAAFVACSYFRRQHYPLPAALSLIFAIGIFPLWCSASYSIIFNQAALFSFLTIYSEHQLMFQILTLLFSLGLILRYRYALLLIPILLQIWYFIYDLPYGQSFSSASIVFAGLCILGLFILRQKNNAYQFWLYTFIGFALWLAIGVELSNANEGLWFLFLTLNILLLYASLAIDQAFFRLLSGIGVIIYAIHLFDLFIRQWQWPWVVVFSIFCILGLALLRLGVYIQQRQAKNRSRNKKT